MYQQLTSKITAFERPQFFVDEMVKGVFKSFVHEHHFEATDYGTLMIDRFDYQSPLGVLGQLADFLFLKRYMTKLLAKRNDTIKDFAVTDQWQLVLHA